MFAEHRNFTTAAAALHISQPALHVKIKKLATALGTELYQRHGRALVLTPAGDRLAAFALDARRRADDFLGELRPGMRTLTIAAGRGTFRWVIPGAIQAISMRGRAIQVIVASRDAAIEALNSGRADIAVIAYDPPSPRTLRAVQIAAFPQVLVIGAEHELAGQDRVRLRDLDGFRLVVPPPGRPHRRALERALLDAGVSWQPAAEADGWDLLVHFAGLGIGATIVNGCVEPPPGLAVVPVADLPAVRYWAVWRAPREAHVSDLAELLSRPAGGS